MAHLVLQPAPARHGTALVLKAMNGVAPGAATASWFSFELAEDECGGAFIIVQCAESDFAAVRDALAKYNEGNAHALR